MEGAKLSIGFQDSYIEVSKRSARLTNKDHFVYAIEAPWLPKLCLSNGQWRVFMKCKINIVLVCLFGMFLQVNSQNLVPNPSFENLSSCPTSNSQYNLASPWQKPLSSITTPDLFNSCFTGGGTCTDMNVPNNFAGNSGARTGSGYAGILTKYTVANLREYLVIELSSPLQAGVSYEIGAYVRLATNSRFATNHFGINVTNGMPSQTTGCCNNGTINLNPTIEENSVISDRSNWTLVGNTYIANGGERFLTLGCFSPDNANNIVDHGFQGGSCALVTNGAYYYLDDVFVTPSVVLSAEDIDFASVAAPNQQAHLQWILQENTAYETLTLERSSDGIHFTALVEGLAPISSDMTDALPFLPSTWYRLSATDKNGETHTTEIQEVNFTPTSGFAVKAWPNPLQEQLTVRIEGEESGATYQIHLRDYLGRTLYQQEIEDQQGWVEFQIEDLSQISSGFYLLQVNKGSQQEVIKLTRL